MTTSTSASTHAARGDGAGATQASDPPTASRMWSSPLRARGPQPQGASTLAGARPPSMCSGFAPIGVVSPVMRWSGHTGRTQVHSHAARVPAALSVSLPSRVSPKEALAKTSTSRTSASTSASRGHNANAATEPSDTVYWPGGEAVVQTCHMCCRTTVADLSGDLPMTSRRPRQHHHQRPNTAEQASR